MDLLKLLRKELFNSYGFIDILNFKAGDDKLYAHFSYLRGTDNQLSYAECEFTILKRKTFFGRYKTNLEVIYISKNIII